MIWTIPTGEAGRYKTHEMKNPSNEGTSVGSMKTVLSMSNMKTSGKVHYAVVWDELSTNSSM
jgi:hypothetical protein